ncbi:MAG: phytoene desaturase family protein [Pseudomonadales bacterium]|nr:phytoene desaturase family protein [Pseudomonadales bacterium]MDP4640701.1 phytoene desaturase family protein [Pseudomonadales bacterium]MDP5059945.1 phytoene desaturase family protein [Pseudomonadales bacterium]
MTHTIVVGAGFGGIATALRCRALGHEVTLLERLEALGGRAQVFVRDGFKHDAGPTVITAPFMFEELFELFQKSLQDYATLVPLDTWYEFYFSDGKTFTYRGDIEHTLEEIARFNPADVAGYKNLLTLSKKIFAVGFEQLSSQPFSRFSTMLKQVPALLRLQSYRTVFGLVSHYIENEHLRKVFSVHPLLVGGNPYTTTSIYTLIHYLERQWGIHFCMGGTGALVDALSKLMTEEQITIRTGCDVDQIQISHGIATGVVLASGEYITADNVIFNGDAPHAYKALLPPGLRRQRIRRPDRLTQYSMGLYVLYFGTRKTYPHIAHHTIWLGPRHKELLEDIFDHHVIPDDFSLYLHRPTATDPSFAPPGCDSFYVLCPVSNLKSGTDWEIEGPKLRNRIVKALGNTILPNLEETICAEFWMTPQDFKTQYRSEHGAGFSIAPTLTQSAYFRYHNRDPEITNLYFTGAGTHPGAGLPGVLSSAKVVENLLTGVST